MSMFTNHRPLHALLFGTAALVAIFIARPVSAATVSYQGACARTTDVAQWTPQKGPVARFVANTFASSTNTGIWIGLGRHGTSFWSAEGGEPNDACDDCRTLHLVETRADGTRKLHTVLGSLDYARIGPNLAAQKAHILGKLWQLASNTWPADKLTHEYTLTLGKPASSAPGRGENLQYLLAPGFCSSKTMIPR